MSNQVFLRSISAVRIGVNGKSDLHAVMRIINATFETGPIFSVSPYDYPWFDFTKPFKFG